MAGLKRECGEMFLQNALSRGRGHQAAPCAQPCRVAALPYPAYDRACILICNITYSFFISRCFFLFRQNTAALMFLMR